MYEKYILVSLNPDRPDEPKKPTILPDEPKKPTILFITVLSQSSYFFIIGLDDDLIFGQDESPDCISPDEPESDMPHPEVNLNTFRDENVDEAGPRQSFVVSRQEGLEELKNDILSCYKNSRCRLKAKMRVRFEGENGVGSGPIREFLLSAMKIVQEGIGKEGKPVIFFEGQDDHKLPVYDQSLRCTGAFRAVGRIIGHSVLHGGTFLFGLSPYLPGLISDCTCLAWRTCINNKLLMTNVISTNDMYVVRII